MTRSRPVFWLWLLLSWGASTAAIGQDSLSAGRYPGDTPPEFDGAALESRLVTMRDGVRLAIDIVRPTRRGVLHRDPLPVVWAHARYHRASIVGEQRRASYQWILPLVRYGYVVAVVDVRGSGASFGTQPGFFSAAETGDLHDVTEWLASQPWSNGRIGMFGRSYLGHAQYFAAAERPPHLRAIFPEMAVFDFYEMLYPGGIFQEFALPTWRLLTRNLDASVPFEWFGTRFGPVAPIDGDSGITLRDAAIAAHRDNWDVGAMWGRVPYRDSRDPETGSMFHRERSPATRLADVDRSGVAIYHLGGWLDPVPRDALLWFANLTVPQRVTVGPWFHSQTMGFDNLVEHRRWYDYWLKGIDNGIMREPPIRYGTFNAHPDSVWRTARRWPPPETRAQRMFLDGGPSGTVASRNDGRLSPRRPRGGGQDEQLVDLSATLGKANRWTNGYGGPAGYPDLAENDAKGWTYTGEALAARLEVTGHPLVRLWLSADRDDADLFVQLEEVLATGESRLVTDGMIRVSHAALGKPPFRNFGLPWHPHRARDTVRLSTTPREVVLDLLPTSYIYRAGSRIRLTVQGADRDNFPAAPIPARITIHRSARYPSALVLPVFPRPS